MTTIDDPTLAQLPPSTPRPCPGCGVSPEEGRCAKGCDEDEREPWRCAGCGAPALDPDGGPAVCSCAVAYWSALAVTCPGCDADLEGEVCDEDCPVRAAELADPAIDDVTF